MTGIGNNLNAGLSGPSASAGKIAGKTAGSNFSSTIKKFIVGAGIGTAITKAFQGGAELQQNLGGTVAVFGNFAKEVQALSQTAYKKMGTSASEYMATANKMASLFQGSGLEQERSMELSTQAMQRAADVASVMGIDVSMALESVAGAAKGNFTMMDNLGVAMNATTLEAYALSKGLDFTWNKASNAEKAELAMQMFFERTAQYAGNFEREASSTISGAFDALKSSAQNLASALVLGNDIKPAWDGFKESVSGVVSAFATLYGQSAMLQQFTQWIIDHEQALSVLGIVIGSLAVAIGAYTLAMNWATIATKVSTAATAAWGAVTAFATSPITLVILGIGALIAVIYLLVKNWDTVSAAAVRCWEAVKKAFSNAGNWFMSNVVNPVVNVFKRMITTIAGIGTAIVQGLWKGISSKVQWLKDKITGWVGNVMQFLKNLFGVHSPSRKTAWIGEMLDRGLAVGISGNTGIIKKSMEKLTSDTLNAFDPTMPALTSRVVTEFNATAVGEKPVNSSLMSQVAELGNRLDNMRVYLDGNKLVGGIVSRTDTALGERQILASRGVI